MTPATVGGQAAGLLYRTVPRQRSRTMANGHQDRVTTPKLAVVITCWNYEAYVSRAIRSVVSQGRDDCELVVIDDGSTDHSWEAITREGVTAYRTENRGQRAACLYGLDHTQAPFVLFLDADDELVPGSLATIIAALDERVAKLQFPLIQIDRDGNVTDANDPSLGTFRSSLTLADRVLRTGVYTTPPTSGNVFRRDVCEYLREVDYDRAVDGVILFIAPFLGDVVGLSQQLGRYRVHDRNDSGLGRPLSAESLRRDIRRFVDRTDHLRRILERSGRAAELVAPEQTYYYLEHSYYLAIVDGQRVSLGNLGRLLVALWSECYPAKTKARLTAYYLITTALPNERARRAIGYRLESGRRSAMGLLRSLL
ncbi:MULTISPECIES: glycosyltransferase family 2 protein [unclassified Rhizobium]|uniref:glycosyltransferase family 2 protein n=1 Tax=unclassified Rhizobium TaxID=2613769 RepID=UPI000A7A58F1